MKICIVGAGLSGLVSAYMLAKECDVEVYESAGTLGGCLSSYNNNGYSLERFYHHFFDGDKSLFDLFKDLGLSGDVEWYEGKTAYYADNRVFPLNTPWEILRYPYISCIDIFRLGLLMIKSKKVDYRDFDDIPAKEYIINMCGTNLYQSFFEPLLKSKFGNMRDQVSAAWLLGRIAIRSNRGISGERLGYLKGGFQSLVEKLQTGIEESGGIIHLNTPVKHVDQYDSGSCVVNGRRYDALISTVAPRVLPDIYGGNAKTIPYQGAVCMTLGLDHDIGNGQYWINMKDDAPYGAVICHTNFVPYERYGEHIVYLASYFSGSLPDGYGDMMISDFCRRFDVPVDSVKWQKLAVEQFAGPVYICGYRKMIPDYSNEGIYLSGMFSEYNYPERSMEGSVASGFEVARRIKAVMNVEDS